MQSHRWLYVPLVTLLLDIAKRLQVLWYWWTGSTDFPHSYMVIKGVKHPEIQLIMITIHTLLIGFVLLMRKTGYHCYNLWISIALTYTVVIFLLADSYSTNVVSSFLVINLLMLNTLLKKEMQSHKLIA